jgi:hypothetical protein
VEAAIVLPIFLLAVFALASLIRMTAVEENIGNALVDETRLLAAEAKVPIRAAAYQTDLTDRIMDENFSEIQSAKLSPFLYRIPYVDPVNGRTYDNLIGASVDYVYDISIPMLPIPMQTGSTTVLTRAFVGSELKGSPMSFDEMEKNDSSKMVWVFPRSGTKYHASSCRFVANEPRETILTSSVRHGFSPCKICKPNELRNGALVYCFPTSGKAYHTGKCTQVEKYVIELSENEAKRNGYGACGVCGG